MNYQYELTHFKGDMGHGVASDADWGDSLNRCYRGGKRNTMVMMFVGGVVMMLDRILVLFLM